MKLCNSGALRLACPWTNRMLIYTSGFVCRVWAFPSTAVASEPRVQSSDLNFCNRASKAGRDFTSLWMGAGFLVLDAGTAVSVKLIEMHLAVADAGRVRG